MWLRFRFSRNYRIPALTSALLLVSAPAFAGSLQLLNGDAQPPVQYLSGPTLTGRTAERIFHSRRDLHDFCSRHLGRPAAGEFYACYVPALDVVALPSARAWPDAAEREALRVHEWSHARGWRHPLRLRTAAVRAASGDDVSQQPR